MAFVGVCGLLCLFGSTDLFEGSNKACVLALLVTHCVSLLSGMFRLL